MVRGAFALSPMSFLSKGVLRHRDFRRLFFGQIISQFGDSVYMLVLLFIANKVTKDPMAVGLVGVMQALPFVFFSPFAGVAADRLDRKKLMLFSDSASAVITFGLAFYAFVEPKPSVAVLAACAFLLSTVNTFFMPARTAAIPRLVPPEDLMEANGLAVATQQFVAMAGLGVSAFVLGAVYRLNPDYFFFWAVFINAITFAVSALFLTGLPEIKATREPSVESDAPPQSWRDNIRAVIRTMNGDLREGLRVMRQDPVIAVALPINVLGTLAISGFMVVYVALNDAWYGGNFDTLALIEFSFVAAMMVFSVVVAKLKLARVGLLFAGINIALGVLVALMAISKPYPLFLIVNLLCGVVLPFLIIPINTYMQTAVPDEVRGRVSSTWGMVSMAMQPLGIGLVGPALGLIGIEGTLVAMGVGLVLAGGYGFLKPAFIRATLPSSATNT